MATPLSIMGILVDDRAEVVIESDLEKLTSFRRELDAIPGLSVQTLSFPQ